MRREAKPARVRAAEMGFGVREWLVALMYLAAVLLGAIAALSIASWLLLGW